MLGYCHESKKLLSKKFFETHPSLYEVISMGDVDYTEHRLPSCPNTPLSPFTNASRILSSCLNEITAHFITDVGAMNWFLTKFHAP